MHVDYMSFGVSVTSETAGRGGRWRGFMKEESAYAIGECLWNPM